MLQISLYHTSQQQRVFNCVPHPSLPVWVGCISTTILLTILDTPIDSSLCQKKKFGFCFDLWGALGGWYGEPKNRFSNLKTYKRSTPSRF